MNLHALRLFYSVAETGSVTQAAKQLNISQPAVTSQIKKLEREIDCTLFVPKGRGILLTQSGAELAKQAKRLFSLEKEIESYGTVKGRVNWKTAYCRHLSPCQLFAAKMAQPL